MPYLKNGSRLKKLKPFQKTEVILKNESHFKKRKPFKKQMPGRPAGGFFYENVNKSFREIGGGAESGLACMPKVLELKCVCHDDD